MQPNIGPKTRALYVALGVAVAAYALLAESLSTGSKVALVVAGVLTVVSGAAGF